MAEVSEGNLHLSATEVEPSDYGHAEVNLGRADSTSRFPGVCVVRCLAFSSGMQECWD